MSFFNDEQPSWGEYFDRQNDIARLEVEVERLQKKNEKLWSVVEALKAWCDEDPRDSYSEPLHKALEALGARMSLEQRLMDPRPKYELIICDHLHFSIFGKQPNWFHRLMQRIFFGFKWRAL